MLTQRQRHKTRSIGRGPLHEDGTCSGSKENNDQEPSPPLQKRRKKKKKGGEGHVGFMIYERRRHLTEGPEEGG